MKAPKSPLNGHALFSVRLPILNVAFTSIIYQLIKSLVIDKSSATPSTRVLQCSKRSRHFFMLPVRFAVSLT